MSAHKLFPPLKALLQGAALTGALWASAGEAAEAVVVSASQDIIRDYRAFLDRRDPRTIEDFSGPQSRRDVVELVLLQQALAQGGFEQPVSFTPESTYQRELRLLANGQRLATGASKWHRDLARVQEHVWITQPLIDNGDFVVGLYTPADNRTLLDGQTGPLRQLRAVTNPHWQADVATLRALGFDRLTYAKNWPSIVRMLDAGRADVTLAPFPDTPDLSLQLGETRLLPLPGVRVAINGTRHWAVSRRHPQGPAFYRALKAGLARLQALGVVERAYRQSGFMSARTADWPLLQPPVQKSRPKAAQ